LLAAVITPKQQVAGSSPARDAYTPSARLVGTSLA
jgi:hypothetical protein